MQSDKLLYRLNRFILNPGRAVGNPHRKIVKLLRIGFQPLFVFEKKTQKRGYGNAFIAVLKRMIFNQQKKEYGGFFD